MRLDLADDLSQRVVVGERVAAVDRQLADIVPRPKDPRARVGPNDDRPNLRRLGIGQRLGQVVDEMDAQGVDGRAVDGDPGRAVHHFGSDERLRFFGDHVGFSFGDPTAGTARRFWSGVSN